MRIRVAGFIVGIAALVASAGAGVAGAATVSGSLQVTATTPTSVSFTATGQRTCVADEQCDYVGDLVELDGAGDCPATYPSDPWYAWNGNVQNTGPTTEVGMFTPRNWLAPSDPGPERLCLYIFADNVYYLADGTVITRPGPPPPGGRTGPPGAFPLPGGGRTAGGATTTTPGTTTPGSTTRTPAPRTVAVRTVALTKAAASAKAALKKAYGRTFTRGKRYRASCKRVGRSRIHVRCTVSWQHAGTWKGTVDVTGAVKSGRQVLVTRVRVRKPRR